MPTRLRLSAQPARAESINSVLAVVREGDEVAYFASGVPVFVHGKDDTTGHRLAAVQMMELGLARQDELSAALHVNRTTLYRQSRKVKAEGVLGVVDSKRGPQGPHRFTRAKREQAQRLLAQGHSIRKTGQQVEVERLAACAKRVPLNTLLDEQEIVRLAPEAKHFTDTIKMLAFRAETPLVLCLTLNGVPTEDGGRALVREMLLSSADIVPQAEEQRLLVRVHSLASPRHNHALAKLCETLNSLEIRYPGTDLMLAYEAPQGA